MFIIFVGIVIVNMLFGLKANGLKYCVQSILNPRLLEPEFKTQVPIITMILLPTYYQSN